MSLWGYEQKHAALHKAGHYEYAINAFQEMLSRMTQSSDPEIRGECQHHNELYLPISHSSALFPVCQSITDDSNNTVEYSGSHP